MADHFGSLVFTPAVKALQEKYGSRRQYERGERSNGSTDRLGPEESHFIAECDSFYMASIGATGWPYVQHRGGPKGFLRQIDDQTIGFADFRGNKQFISTGNLATNSRVALIIVDYPRQARLKLLGHAEIFEGGPAQEWIERLRVPGYKALIERAYVIRVQAFSWNCPQHIKQRFSADQIQEVLEPLEAHLRELQQENKKLREERDSSGRLEDYQTGGVNEASTR